MAGPEGPFLLPDLGLCDSFLCYISGVLLQQPSGEGIIEGLLHFKTFLVS